MFNFNSLNHTNKFTFEVPEDTVFCKLEELKDVKEPIVVRTMYINTKGKFADHPVFGVTVGNDFKFVDMPAHMTNDVNEILGNDEAIAEVNAGHCGIVVRPYYSKKYAKDCYSADFTNIDECIMLC